MNHRSHRREVRQLKESLQGPNAVDVFVLHFSDGTSQEITAPTSNAGRLEWITTMMGTPDHPTSQLIRTCVDWSQSCDGQEISMIRSTPSGADYATFRRAEAAEATARHAQQLRELGIEVEQAQQVEAPAPQPEATPLDNVISMPAPTEEIQ